MMVDFEKLMQAISAGAQVVFLVLFIRGDIVSMKTIKLVAAELADEIIKKIMVASKDEKHDE